ncbi:protein downstream neighbor of son homolog isoform X2 [Scylla paramamosain]|uniref:protein downstream neighbor of son homolog isoform X2 n=1 Tax=Scylla paramamosain TaxID=85552 RepID=UPI003083A793
MIQYLDFATKKMKDAHFKKRANYPTSDVTRWLPGCKQTSDGEQEEQQRHFLIKRLLSHTCEPHLCHTHLATMSPVGGVGSPAPWVRPADVMKQRLKARKRLLQARISATPLQVLAPSSSPASPSPSPGHVAAAAAAVAVKRRNPFRSSPNKRQCQEPHGGVEDDTTDATLFQLLHPHQAEVLTTTTTITTTKKAPTSFTNVLRAAEGVFAEGAEKEATKTHWADHLPLDWCLKSRLRFRSNKPLPWKHTFKTSEEASGITGFVRCLAEGGCSGEAGERTLDTSANAQFYQRCLVWQHPALPWLGTLFPRHPHRGPSSSSAGGVGSLSPKVVEVLRAEWSESLRSLHQLLRVRQCPYFYVCGAAFTVLFRAAGVAGVSQAHALITPTTRGLREAMRAEDIEFEMPFNRSETSGDKTGKEEEEEEEEEAAEEEVEQEEEEEGEEKGEATSWLEDLGLETSQFPNLNPSRAKVERERQVDSRPSSLVCVEGMETQALINFLINSKSCVAITGELAGVPPTLLAPVAFQGATLRPLKVKGAMVRQGGVTQHSMEVSGPLLPHTVHQLATLLAQTVDTFTLSLAPVASSLPFALHTQQEATAAPQAFAQEGLVDCGLDASTRQLLCAPTASHPPLPPTYREVTCQDARFTWSDK